jgi:hypothetical protein
LHLLTFLVVSLQEKLQKFSISNMHTIFALGRRIQHERGENTSDDIQTLNTLLEKEQQTFLSPLVHEMLAVNTIPELQEDFSTVVTSRGTLNWSYFTCSRMTNGGSALTEEEQFKEASIYLRKALLTHIHPFMQKILEQDPIEDVMNLYHPFMTFLPRLTTVPDIPELQSHITVDNALFIELWHLYRMKEYELCCLMGFTFIERSIGDIVAGIHNWPATKMLKMSGMYFALVALIV